MLNNVVLVGRVVAEPELTVYESGVRSTKVFLSVVKPFRNEKNEYETDIIPIYVWYKMADIVCEYVGVGSIVGFKCRLSTHRMESDNIRLNLIDVIAERVSFIDTKPRTGKATKDYDDLTIEKELQNGTFNNLEIDDLKDKEDVVFDDDLADNNEGVDKEIKKKKAK